ncbi:ABC transporter substrate-binding protein [Microbacterium sp. 18062]|uniref:ABC transporter substrate-binding protein n=1 Tax=Microbacterium sp. 18062 TaxID=2681410 RepID=UPI00135695BF|nr:ABC transporter substrate-binding protein [Microbacterium sp. 18062]
MAKRSFTGRLATAVAGGAMTAAALAGCSPGGAEAGSSGEPATRTVNVAVLPTSNMAAVYLGEEEGFFAEEGLELSMTTVGGGAEMIAGLQAGSFDFVVAGYVPLFAAAANGLPLSIISANDVGGATPDEEWQALVVGADSTAQSVQDLEGATVGVNALKGVAEATIRASLQQQGVDDTAVQFVEIPFSEVPAALANGTVDAAFGSEPFITGTLGDGGRILDTPSYNLGANFPNGAWATSADLVESDPDLVDRFTAAITASVDHAAENDDAVRQILPTFTALSPELAAEIRLPIFRSALDREQLETLVEILVEFGVVDRAPDLDQLIEG